MTIQTNWEPLLSEVREYYSRKLKQFGATPCGVDWRDADSQRHRFEHLLEVFHPPGAGSLIELGCGYGALYLHLKQIGWDITYVGYDIAAEAISAANGAIGHDPRAIVKAGHLPTETADYCVASGIFNVRFDVSDEDWKNYILSTLETMAMCSSKGFAFNALTRFSDPERQERRLFYADPGEILNLCIARFGKHVRLLHGCGLYEFTIVIWHTDNRGSMGRGP